MLTRELAIAEYDFIHGRLIPDRLTRKQHPQYPAYAERMLQVYARGKGRTRRELHQSVHGIFANEGGWTMRVGGMQAVSRDPASGRLTGACDPRRDGYVATP